MTNVNMADWIRKHWPDIFQGAVACGNRLAVFGSGMDSDPRAATSLGFISAWVNHRTGTVLQTQLDSQEHDTWAVVAEFPLGVEPDEKEAAGVLMKPWESEGFFADSISTPNGRGRAVLFVRAQLNRERLNELAGQIHGIAEGAGSNA